MQSQVNEIDPVTVQLEVEVPWDRVRKGLSAGYGQLQKSAKVRGFRPGKVPRSVLQKLYGPQVRGEVVASLVEEGLLAAVQEHELAIVATPEVEGVPAIAKGEALTFKAKIEVRPKIDKVDFEGLELLRPSSAIDDQAVEDEIERLRQGQADLVTPEEARPAKAGDSLTLTYTVEIDGEPKDEMAAEDRVVELGAGRLLPEFEEALAGASVGGDVEIEVAYDDETPNPDLKGKTAVFKVNVVGLQEKVVPDLDDELAKDLGEHETLAELRLATRKRLQDAADERAKSAVREQVVEKLCAKNPVQVPPSLVSQQEQAMRQELAWLMRMTGQAGGLAEELEAGMGGRAESKVRAGLLMGELASQEDIAVAPEEVDAKLAEIAESSGKHIAKVRVEYAGERREQLENKLLEDKLLDFLVSRATVTDAPPQSDDPQSAGGSETGAKGVDDAPSADQG